MSVRDEAYSRKTSCVLNYIPTFLGLRIKPRTHFKATFRNWWKLTQITMLLNNYVFLRWQKHVIGMKWYECTRLSNITLSHKFKQKNCAIIANYSRVFYNENYSYWNVHYLIWIRLHKRLWRQHAFILIQFKF